jgi:hypothetical protein
VILEQMHRASPESRAALIFSLFAKLPALPEVADLTSAVSFPSVFLPNIKNPIFFGTFGGRIAHVNVEAYFLKNTIFLGSCFSREAR